jgi:hypothetical protein
VLSITTLAASEMRQRRTKSKELTTHTHQLRSGPIDLFLPNMSDNAASVLENAFVKVQQRLDHVASHQARECASEQSLIREWTLKLRQRMAKRPSWGRSCTSRVDAETCEERSSKHSSTAVQCEWKRPWYVVGKSSCMPNEQQWETAVEVLSEFAKAPKEYSPVHHEQAFNLLLLPFDGFLEDIHASMGGGTAGVESTFRLEGHWGADTVALVFIFCHEVWKALRNGSTTLPVLRLMRADPRSMLALLLLICFSQQSFLGKLTCIQQMFAASEKPATASAVSSTSSTTARVKAPAGAASKTLLTGFLSLLLVAPQVVLASNSSWSKPESSTGGSSALRKLTEPFSALVTTGTVPLTKQAYAELSERVHTIERQYEHSMSMMQRLQDIVSTMVPSGAHQEYYFKHLQTFGTEMFYLVAETQMWSEYTRLQSMLPTAFTELDASVRDLETKLRNTPAYSRRLLAEDGIFQAFFKTLTAQYQRGKHVASASSAAYVLTNMAQSISKVIATVDAQGDEMRSKQARHAALALTFARTAIEKLDTAAASVAELEPSLREERLRSLHFSNKEILTRVKQDFGSAFDLNDAVAWGDVLDTMNENFKWVQTQRALNGSLRRERTQAKELEREKGLRKVSEALLAYSDTLRSESISVPFGMASIAGASAIVALLLAMWLAKGDKMVTVMMQQHQPSATSAPATSATSSASPSVELLRVALGGCAIGQLRSIPGSDLTYVRQSGKSGSIKKDWIDALLATPENIAAVQRFLSAF